MKRQPGEAAGLVGNTGQHNSSARQRKRAGFRYKHITNTVMLGMKAPWL